MSLFLGPLELPHAIVTAPLAGITDAPFRRILRRYTKGLIETEQYSANALYFNSQKSLGLLHSVMGEQGPVSIQIFGGDEIYMRNAAYRAKELHPAVIDINMGCPDRRVMASGGGAALLGDLEKAVRIARAVVEEASPTPVTVKMRSGLTQNTIVAQELTQRLEEIGVVGVVIHPRTAKQKYGGPPDLAVVRAVKESAGSIPVIASGCAAELSDIEPVLRETGVDGIMLGRPLLGRPWILPYAINEVERVKSGAVLSDSNLLTVPDPPREDLFALMREHAKLSVDLLGRYCGSREIRKHLAWYAKGFKDASKLRNSLVRVESFEEVDSLLTAFAQEHPPAAE